MAQGIKRETLFPLEILRLYWDRAESAGYNITSNYSLFPPGIIATPGLFKQY